MSDKSLNYGRTALAGASPECQFCSCLGAGQVFQDNAQRRKIEGHNFPRKCVFFLTLQAQQYGTLFRANLPTNIWEFEGSRTLRGFGWTQRHMSMIFQQPQYWRHKQVESCLLYLVSQYTVEVMRIHICLQGLSQMVQLPLLQQCNTCSNC